MATVYGWATQKAHLLVNNQGTPRDQSERSESQERGPSSQQSKKIGIVLKSASATSVTNQSRWQMLRILLAILGIAWGAPCPTTLVYPTGFQQPLVDSTFVLNPTSIPIFDDFKNPTISPALPADLSFTSASGKISGTPTATTTDAAVYTISYTDVRLPLIMSDFLTPSSLYSATRLLQRQLCHFKCSHHS